MGFDDFAPTQVASTSPTDQRFNQFVDALEQTESGGGVNLFNKRTGATGPLQVTRIAAEDIGGDYNRALEDHAYARGLGVKYARKIWDQFGGVPELAAAAYHTGPTQIRRWINQAKALGIDAKDYVLDQLGPEGSGHNKKTMKYFKQGIEDSTLSYDPDTGRMEGKTPKESVLYQSRMPEGEPSFDDFTKPEEPFKFGRHTTEALSWLNMVVGLPGFVAGSLGSVGSAIVGSVGQLLGSGESSRDVYKSAIGHGKYISDITDRLLNPVAQALKVWGDQETTDKTVVNQAMGAIDKAITDYSRHVEKQYGVPAEGVEIAVKEAMALTPTAKTKGAPAGLGSRATYKAPVSRSTFDDFVARGDTAKMDSFIKETLAEGEKAEATSAKKQELIRTVAKLTGGAAAGGTAAYLLQKFRSQGNETIQGPDTQPEPTPTENGTFLANDSLPDWKQLVPLLVAAGWVKAPGGMWHPEAVERLARPLAKQLHGGFENTGKRLPQDVWAERAIRNYLNKYAGTERDPLKDVQVPFGEGTKRWEELWDSSIGKHKTEEYPHLYGGMDPPKGARLGEDVHMFGWQEDRPRIGYGENSPDSVITSYLSHVGDYLRQHYQPGLYHAGRWYSELASDAFKKANPKPELNTLLESSTWLDKIEKSPEYQRYKNPLQQLDLVRAVRETAANDARVAKEMEKAAQASMKDLPVYKDYGDGYKWVELKLPEKWSEEQAKGVRLATEQELNSFSGFENLGQHEKGYVAIDARGEPIRNTYTGEIAIGDTPKKAHLAGQLAQEGNQMGHCVGGYCEPVASGESRIFSLRDAKGRSHVTVEVEPPMKGDLKHEIIRTPEGKFRIELKDAQGDILEVFESGATTLEGAKAQFEQWANLTENYRRVAGPENITQIKGKQNRAPSAEYLPYVQDFVRSGKWGDVGDLGNTGLIDTHRISESGLSINPPFDIQPHEWQKLEGRIPVRRSNGWSELVGNQYHVDRAKQLGRYISPKEATDVLREDVEKLIGRKLQWEASKEPEQGIRGPRDQQGNIDPRLMKALALAGVGAAVGSYAFPEDRLTAGLVGGLLALGLGSGKVSEVPRLLGDNKLTRSVERGIKATVEQFQRNVNPDLMGEQARSAASVLGKAYTEMMQRQLAIEAPSAKRSTFWISQGSTASRDFLNKMEKGATFTDPTMNQFAQAYRNWMNRIYQSDAGMGIKYDPIDNYIYHAFEDPKGAADFFTKKYGIKWGDPNFTKGRTFDLIKDAEEHGFRLKTDNPESLMVMRQHASDIAHLKINALRDLAEYGLARRIGKGDKLNADETLWRAPNGELYGLPAQTNQIMHNAFNTRSLWADPGIMGQVYRGLSYLKNAIVPVQLFSLFHPLHVQLGMSFADPLVAMTKKVAAGKADFIDLTKEALSKVFLTDIISTPKQGWRMLEAFRGNVPYNKLTDVEKRSLSLMTEGTFNPTMPIEYRNRHVQNFKDAIAAHSVAAAWHLPWAVMEKFYTRPIFEQWIPAVKTAAYLRGAYAALEANPALLNSPLERMNALRKISKMVDDRFGEVQYKTLFMNRALKDVAVASFLSYGWQLGFVRSYIGAVPEAVAASRASGSLREKIARGDLDKSMFVGYYVMGTMLYGGLLNYALTGDAPREIMDYIFPRTGDKNPDGSPARVSTPFYTREFVSVPKHLQEEGIGKGMAVIIGNKLSPAIGMIKAMATNRDFFNREISNPNAGVMTQLGQKLAFAFKGLEPIAWTGAKQGPDTTKTKVLSSLGFSPAPKYVTQSLMEQRISHTFRTYNPTVTPYDKAAYSEDMAGLYRLRQQGDDAKFQTELGKMQEKYGLNANQVKLIQRNSLIPSSERMFRRLNEQQQQRLWKDMSAQEKERFRPYLKKNIRYQD